MLARLLKCSMRPFCNLTDSLKIDLTRYLNKATGWEEDCHTVGQNFRKCGFMYAHDPRADLSKNDRLLDQMEKYFALRSRQFEEGDRNLDVCVHGLKVGLQQNYTTVRQAYTEEKKALKQGNLAITPMQPKVDPVWRYHWLLNSDHNIVPQDFPDFGENLDSWGKQLFKTNITIAQMTAFALGLDKDALSKTFINGANYLSPPAMDLSKSKLGEVITGFHRDFGIITVHAPTRFEGLSAWMLTGEKVSVKIPDGHLLIQAGKQLEWLTGGYLKAGFHEVIHNREVEAQVKSNLKNGKSNWRVVPALYSYVQGSLRLKPFKEFSNEGVEKVYPNITADEYMLQQLKEDWKRKPKE